MGLYRFDTDLRPVLEEMAIDRVRLKVPGRWRAAAPRLEMLNRFQDYLQYIGTMDANFERVGSLGRRAFLTIRQTAPLTIRGTFTLVRDLDVAHNLFVNLDINPTRTLEHLLRLYGNRPDFALVIAAMEPTEFFRRAPSPHIAAAGSDNFISDMSLARFLLSRDIFASFLPIFVNQLRAWVEQTLLWGEYENEIRHVNGSTGLATYYTGPAGVGPENFLVRLDWQSVALQLTEVYFERHHPDAHMAVERLARSSLAGLRDVRIQRYNDDPDGSDDHASDESGLTSTLPAGVLDHVRRESGELAVGGKLTGDRRYTIYAKNDGRLRFELKYDGLPLIHGQPPNADPSLCLIERLERARSVAMNDMRWANVGLYCTALPDSPPDALADLLEALEGTIAGEHGVTTSGIIRELLTSGGLTEDANSLSRAILERLERRGVVRHLPVRLRSERYAPRRYVLTSTYRALREALLASP